MQNLNITNVDQLATALEAAQTQRKKWEDGAFAASNDKLYAILAAALDVCQVCIANPDLTDGITSLLKLRKLQYSSNTSLELKVVRLVFAEPHTQSKYKYRLLSYARVLNSALNDGQTSATLAQYIIDQGGIDEIRRSASQKSNEPQPMQYVSVASKTFADVQCNGLFDAFTLPVELKPLNGSRYSIALVRDNQDGTGTIVKGLKSNALVERALEEAGKAITEEVSHLATQNLFDGTAKHQSNNQQLAAATIDSAFKPALSLSEPASASE